MNDNLWVSTRKGLFSFEKIDGRWKVTTTAFLGDPVRMTLTDPRDSTLYAALQLGHYGTKLRRSEDGGKSWTEIGVPEYPKVPDDEGAASLKDIWALEPGGADQEGRLWCGTIPGGLFRSDDRGESWNLVESLWEMPERKQWFGGGADHPAIHSICVHPEKSTSVTVGVSCGGVWLSEDDGTSWTVHASGMYAEYMPPDRREDPIIQDPHRVVQSPSHPDHFWCQHHNGIFRSTDALGSWQSIEDVKPSTFGFGVAVHPTDPETAWFVPAVDDESRYPVEGELVVTRTRDGGRSFEILREGLPQEHAYDLVFRHALDIDGSGDRLAIGSTTGGLWITENGGDSWQAISMNLPPIYAVEFDTRS